MPAPQRPTIISVTGTKGKSTITYVLSSILHNLESVLRVDTTGYYINGEQKGTFADSTRVAGLVPTVAPGRFLTAMQDVDSFVAVLECSLGSSNAPGLGYSHHRVGIFTNVFEDHLGSTKRLQTKQDIAQAKRFIFARIHPDGYAVFNADDELVCSQLDALKSTVTQVPCGITFATYDIDNHLKNGGVCVTVVDGWIAIKSQIKTVKIVAIKDVAWTFGGLYQPSVQNLMLITGALWSYNQGALPLAQRTLLKESKLNPYGGRLTPLVSDSGVRIIADYAHEKYSLAAIGKLAHQLKRGEDSKVIGVVRLAYDRTDELITETAAHIAPEFDEFIVYDKIDGFWRKPKKTIGSFKMKTGYISDVLHRGLLNSGAKSTRIIREDDAIARAASIAKPGDVVIVIVNDNIERSVGFIRENFNAEFI